ncbi:MAG: UDP-glucose/GDP-mannose dehydrogenase family protein, partial [Bacteroidales bacterium]
LTLIDSLLEAGCEVVAYDPVAMDESKRRIGDKITYAKNLYDTVVDADAIFHVTEWKEFRMPSWEVIKRSMKASPVLIDGRNVFDHSELMEHGFAYYCIGR